VARKYLVVYPFFFENSLPSRVVFCGLASILKRPRNVHLAFLRIFFRASDFVVFLNYCIVYSSDERE